MNKLFKAKTLLKSLESYENLMVDIRSDLGTEFSPSNEYMQSLGDRLRNILRVSVETFDDDKGFLESLMGEIGEYGPTDMQSDIIRNYLEVYLEVRRPTYMEDLLQHAESFINERLYNNAAFSTRLYAETCLKIKLENYEFVKGNTFGWIWRESKKEGLIDENLFNKYMPRIQELNDMVHNHIGPDYCSETVKKITNLIQWAREYEFDIESLNVKC